MSGLLNPGWRDELVKRLNSSSDFHSASLWFDGSVLLEMGGESAWLKIYAGRVIDVQNKASPFGFSFALRAPERVWAELLRNPRNMILSFTGSGRISVEGNQLEFMRLTKTVVTLVDGMRALVQSGGDD